MPEQRRVRLFRNGRNQAARIPVEFELPGDEAIMHRDGDQLVIEPVRRRGLVRPAQEHEAAGRGFSRDRRSRAGTEEDARTCYMPETSIVSDVIRKPYG